MIIGFQWNRVRQNSSSRFLRKNWIAAILESETVCPYTKDRPS